MLFVPRIFSSKNSTAPVTPSGCSALRSTHTLSSSSGESKSSSCRIVAALDQALGCLDDHFGYLDVALCRLILSWLHLAGNRIAVPHVEAADL